jgi:hypothetical protein
MYCPRCAEQNIDDAKFCRACGEDLSVIAQAMARRFPVSLLSKMDAYLERKNERLRRDSMLGFFFGTVFLFLCLYHLLVQREGLSLNVGLTLAMSTLTYLWAAWDFLVYKRSFSKNVAELPGETHTRALKPQARDEQAVLTQQSSITEETTRHLDSKINRPNKTS